MAEVVVVGQVAVMGSRGIGRSGGVMVGGLLSRLRLCSCLGCYNAHIKPFGRGASG